MTEIIIAALYKFTALDDLEGRRLRLHEVCAQAEVRGTLLLAEEGINGTIAGSRSGIDAVLAHLRAQPELADLAPREALHESIPFKRLKVRIKREVVTFGVDGVDPTARVGSYVHPRQWNSLIDDPDVLVIDTRNDFEVEVGTFQGAVNPETANFSDFPEYVRANLDPKKHQKVAMFCTGGIRCEKATSYLLDRGFEDVYHLQGGILHYLEEVPEEESRWRGRCFVFDERESVD